MTIGPAEEGGELLTAAMKRRGMSAPDLAAATDGQVSSSSIRGYLRGEQVPRASTAIVIARAFSVGEGAPLLRAWGYKEAADGLEEPWPLTANPPAFSYVIESDSKVPHRSVPLGWRQNIEILGRIETSQGFESLARADSGTLVFVRPVFGLELLPDFAESLVPSEDETE
ncbi:MAG: helix-turn-helix domain-containing protein [Acidimicrobiia bacterium]